MVPMLAGLLALLAMSATLVVANPQLAPAPARPQADSPRLGLGAITPAILAAASPRLLLAMMVEGFMDLLVLVAVALLAVYLVELAAILVVLRRGQEVVAAARRQVRGSGYYS